MAKKPRDYRKEYDTYQGTPEQIANRASRNAARQKVTKAKGADAVAGRDVNHKNGNPRDNSPSNLNIESKAVNRARKPKKGKG